MRPSTDEHDYQVRLRSATKFLQKVQRHFVALLSRCLPSAVLPPRAMPCSHGFQLFAALNDGAFARVEPAHAGFGFSAAPLRTLLSAQTGSWHPKTPCALTLICISKCNIKSTIFNNYINI